MDKKNFSILYFAIILVAAIGVGAFFVFRGGDKSESSPSEWIPTPRIKPNPTPQPPTIGGQLLFRSGFEEGVVISPPHIPRNGNQWWQLIQGMDEETGFMWPNGLPGRNSSGFQTIVSKDKDPEDYFHIDLQTIEGPRGNQTRVLYMENRDIDKTIGHSRGQLTVAAAPGRDLQQGYVRYWIKLQPDYLETIRNKQDTWRTLMEWKEPPFPGTYVTNYRINITIKYERELQRLVWQGWGEDIKPLENKRVQRTKNFVLYNNDVPVPLGEWFLLEAFWKQGDDDNGRFWFAITPQGEQQQVVVDYTGRTQGLTPLPIDVWYIFKLYTGFDWHTDGGRAYQYIDDIEIWSDFPPTS